MNKPFDNGCTTESQINFNCTEDSARTLLHSPVAVRKPSAGEVAHYLVVVEGTDCGKRLEIGLTPMTIGRHRDNRFVLMDPFVSGHHCRVTFEEGTIWVTDLDSTNGTFIDGVRIKDRTLWPIGASLQIGHHVLRQEYRYREEAPKSADLACELRRAATYVQTLLPHPLVSGPVTTAWQFLPCAGLGGDIFDYFWLDTERFVFYLLDVCGHGIGAALHSISIFNLLRQRSLCGVDFAQPAQVLNALNKCLPMESYAGMYCTLWYGVYHSRTGALTFASAGHPPALLAHEQSKRCVPLSTDHPPIGIAADVDYQATAIVLPPESRLYLYSDGAYEIPLGNGELWSWEGFVELLQECLRNGLRAPEQILREITALTQPHHFEDDLSLLAVNIHADCPRG